ncbi:hypothetical protein BABINDRAFT_42226 [Babjeviella inositovora NRRL Y-12698]|uniref:tRNA (guanine(10)-N(2))-methyltransferase n=1 Tax=Babjeviella inositovora NRRL Y-12698 TaxID=984486 RepID=A0A1E3QJ14_9ASCO|nr:uncharacterized protein BABINDRAFT_42226 [Babjeviella inositovora NRRL Y-12698]ODQ77062.1 hypothetical protein BABINDRAFT_42226 [Babjeviella inositovora NRRL Y-12698]
MKQYLIYFAQAYTNFRLPELESLAVLHSIKVDLSHHSELTPFLIVELENDEQAKKLVERAMLTRGIYELWGSTGNDSVSQLHENIQSQSFFEERIRIYEQNSFKFEFIGFKGSREKKEMVDIIESFQYTAFKGPVRMKNPDQVFTVLEEYTVQGQNSTDKPDRMWFGRQISLTDRTTGVLDEYDLRRRKYIGTTSFDAELALVSCNIGGVDKGKIMCDPFTGTGSFLVAAAHYGGIAFGSDIDVRALKGKGQRTIQANFKQYGTSLYLGDIFTMDFTHNCFRKDFVIDSIICDPPYGIREGLKVCGVKDAAKAEGKENVIINGEKAFLRKDFVQPKKPYELSALLDDLLQFASERLPVGGRVAFWTPTADDDFIPTQIPQHEQLELLYNLEQNFHKWSRRLLVYVKRDASYKGVTKNATVGDNFRERYFQSFN